MERAKIQAIQTPSYILRPQKKIAHLALNISYISVKDKGKVIWDSSMKIPQDFEKVASLSLSDEK